MVNRLLDDIMNSDTDKNYMISEQEAMVFVISWTKWGLQQLLTAWD